MAEITPPVIEPTQVKDQSGLALAGFIIALLSIPLSFIPCIGSISSILGIVFGAIGVRSAKKGLAIASIIISCITLIFSFLAPVLGLALLGPSINNMFEDIINTI
jgi:hypothetical protein